MKYLFNSRLLYHMDILRRSLKHVKVSRENQILTLLTVVNLPRLYNRTNRHYQVCLQSDSKM